jgi:hypothetical protein
MTSNYFRPISLHGVRGHSVKLNSYGQPMRLIYHFWMSFLLPVEAKSSSGQLSGILEAREEEARVKTAGLMKEIA